jgi:hypothetical protein
LQRIFNLRNMKADKRKNNQWQPKKEANQKKIPVTIYETVEDVLLLGGKEAVRKIMKEAVAIALVDMEHAAATNPIPDAYENSKPGL